MAIPASVLTYINWKSANLSGTTYTTVAPEKPVGYALTFNANNTIVASGGTPWLTSQELVDLDNNFACAVTSTISASHAQATQGRVMWEFSGFSPPGANVLANLAATTPANGLVRVQISGGGLVVARVSWNGGNDSNVDLSSLPSNPWAIEIIYDTNNATRANRIKARMWELGGSVPSFTDNSADSFSSANTTDQFTALDISTGGNLITGWKSGRVAVSNDIAEDLSALTEGAGATGPAIGARYLIGPWVR